MEEADQVTTLDESPNFHAVRQQDVALVMLGLRDEFQIIAAQLNSNFDRTFAGAPVKIISPDYYVYL